MSYNSGIIVLAFIISNQPCASHSPDSNGNRTEWSTIQRVIGRVISSINNKMRETLVLKI